jgi:hypothetical protein
MNRPRISRRTTTTAIDSADQIPAFHTEAEEQAFWATHTLSDRMLDQAEPIPEEDLPPVRERTSPIPIRFDLDVLRRLRVLATRKHTGYQTLLKQFVVERLYEEEKREGLV